MASAFQRRRDRYTATFAHEELTVVVLLLEQTRALLGVTTTEEQPGDEFEHLMRSAGWPDQIVEDPPQDRPAATPPPAADPALRRLLPDPNPADPAASAEFRRLTGMGLRERKAATISAAIDALGRGQGERGEIALDLDQEQAQSVLVALTDLRLVLGERLELSTQEDPEEVIHHLQHSLESDDPRVAMAFAYDFLTWVQESLAQAMLPD